MKGVITMKKSKVETAETRKRIVATASELFLEKGLSDVGIADVMLAAGLTQGGFYRHFESKDQLIAEANRAANEKLFLYYSQATEGMAPLAAIQAIVTLYLNQDQGQGAGSLCPLANLGSELRHANDHIRSVAMEGYQHLAAAFAMLAGQMGVQHGASVADAIVSTIVGAVTLARLAIDPQMAKSIVDNAELSVRNLLLAATAPLERELLRA